MVTSIFSPLVVKFVFFLAGNFSPCQESLFQSRFATMLQSVQLFETHFFRAFVISCFRGSFVFFGSGWSGLGLTGLMGGGSTHDTVRTISETRFPTY